MYVASTNTHRYLLLLSAVSFVYVHAVNGAVVEYPDDLRVSHYNQKCLSSDDCFDYRLVCKKRDDAAADDDDTRCVCDMFHTWSEEFSVCVQRYNSTHMVSLLIEKYDHAGNIEREARMIYLGAVAAGFVVMSIGMMCVIAIVCYCHHMKIRDNQLKALVASYKKLKEQIDEKKAKQKDNDRENEPTSSNENTLRRENVKINIMRIEQEQK